MILNINFLRQLGHRVFGLTVVLALLGSVRASAQEEAQVLTPPQWVAAVETSYPVAAQFAVLEGRTFVFLPYEEGGRAKVYELADDGTATERADTVGDLFKWVKVR